MKSLLTILLTSFIAVAGVATAQSKYPKINLAAGYKVDAAWPQKPPEIKWRYVTGVAVDSQNRVWVLNEIKPQVQVYSADGKFLDSWSSDDFKKPHSIRLDREGNIWITDFGAHIVQKFSPKGKLLLTLGTLNTPGCDATHFGRPTDVAIAPNGDLFVTDGYSNNRVVHFDASGKFVKSWGELGVEPGQLSQPHHIVMDSRGRLYVAERNNCRIQVFDQNGKSLAQWRNLINPWCLWVTPQDEILVSGSSPARWTQRGNLGNPPHDAMVMKFDTGGRALELWTFPLCKPGTMEPGELDWIHAMAADSKGNLYLGDVADNSPAHRVQKFTRLPAER